ncbi:MAG: TetR/AcrR family transcriptional regulator [Calditrichaeota bacterium]|nr:TetR/AcrR family transcriptional regulator [Calditrichota bacterium]
MRQSKKDHLLATATQLFLKNGFQITGIDLIIKEAAIAKMTLYNNFKNKDELILAVVENYAKQFAERITKRAEAMSDDPLIVLISIFDAYKEWYADPQFFGCAFQRAALEFPDTDHPVHQLAAGHNQFIRNYILEQCNRLEIDSAADLAEQLHVLINGASTGALLYADPEQAEAAKDAAKLLIQSYV